MDGFDQTVIHGDRNVRAEQRRFARALVAAHVGIVAVHLDAARIQRGKRVVELAVGAEHCLERVLADAAIGAFAEHAEIAGGELHLFAVLILDLRQHQIHVRQHFIRIGRRLRRVAEPCEHPFALLVEAVRPRAGDVLRKVTVGRHFLRRKECSERFLRDCQDLRLDERGRHAELDVQVRRLAVHFLMLRVAAVRGTVQVGIAVDALQPFADGAHRVDAGFEGFAALAERALHGGELGNLLGQRVQLGFPSLVARIDRGKVPLIAGVDFVSGFHTVLLLYFRW